MSTRPSATRAGAVPADPDPNRGTRGLALVVDDDITNRFILAGVMRSLGFDVEEVQDGLAAVSFVGHTVPDIILMDIMMPRMDGFEATRLIRLQVVDAYVPILFHTAIDDNSILLRCIEAGGDDFFLKPYDPSLLEAKLVAVQRNIELHARLRRNRDELALYRTRLENDLSVAASIYATIFQRQAEALDAPHVDFHLKPVEAMNGDLILGCVSPTGTRMFLIGDCTGHGLPAALCAMKVSDIFYSMAKKGFALTEIVFELNLRLNAIMPTNRFFAAALLALNEECTSLSVWNGGMPDVLITNGRGDITRTVKSSNLPLAIVENSDLEPKIEVLPVNDGTRFFACSDGLIEAHENPNNIFGDRRVREIIATSRESGMAIPRLLREIEQHVGGSELHDDVSMLEVRCIPARADPTVRFSGAVGASRAPSAWSFEACFDHDAIRHSDPLPPLVNYVTDIQGLAAHRQAIYTILAELYANAVDHGLLGLDSSVKHDPEGFTRYYGSRADALENLQDASVRVAFAHTPEADGGLLELVVEHSGDGFDCQAVLAAATEPVMGERLHGRGVRLVLALSEALSYERGGRLARVRYRWQGVNLRAAAEHG